MEIIQLLFFFLIIVPSAIIHEYAHGWAADQLGDSTARDAGRLTLNPIAHIDLVGTIILPVALIILPGSLMFAYAKPVPFNPYNLRDKKWSPILVALAGPISNLFTALCFSLVFRFLPAGIVSSNFLDLISIVIYANILLAVFNLIPIPPLDGSKVVLYLLPDSAWRFKEAYEKNGIFILLFLVMFGFIGFISPVITWLLVNFLGIEGTMRLFQMLSGIF